MKLHLACGERYFPGYIHIDLGDFPHIDYQISMDKLPFEDNSAELIYCCHALPYYDRFEVITVLREWYRVLKSGGILRLSVSNFPALIEVYQKTGDLTKILGPLFGRWKPNNTTEYIYERTVYDEKLLISILQQANFKNIRRWNWRDVFIGELADIDDHSQAYYPYMEKEKGIHISLNIEAAK